MAESSNKKGMWLREEGAKILGSEAGAIPMGKDAKILAQNQ